jgi:hypothetical protein
MTHFVLSGFTPVSATLYPISPESSNPQDFTTLDSDFSFSDKDRIIVRTYIANPSLVKVLYCKGAIHQFINSSIHQFINSSIHQFINSSPRLKPGAFLPPLNPSLQTAHRGLKLIIMAPEATLDNP